MPKAKLEFNLPEEADEFKVASQAMFMSIAIDDFRNRLRSIYKHGDLKSDEARKLIDDLYSEYNETMSEFIG